MGFSLQPSEPEMRKLEAKDLREIPQNSVRGYQDEQRTQLILNFESLSFPYRVPTLYNAYPLLGPSIIYLSIRIMPRHGQSLTRFNVHGLFHSCAHKTLLSSHYQHNVVFNIEHGEQSKPNQFSLSRGYQAIRANLHTERGVVCVHACTVYPQKGEKSKQMHFTQPTVQAMLANKLQ